MEEVKITFYDKVKIFILFNFILPRMIKFAEAEQERLLRDIDKGIKDWLEGKEV